METWRVEVVNEVAKAEIDALPIDIRAKLLEIAIIYDSMADRAVKRETRAKTSAPGPPIDSSKG